MVWHQTDLNKESVQSHQSWDNQEEISENMAKPLQFSVGVRLYCDIRVDASDLDSFPEIFTLIFRCVFKSSFILYVKV